MKFKILKKLLALSFFLMSAWLFNANAVLAQSNSAQTTVGVIVVAENFCNSNAICEPVFGENESDCFNDCGCNNNNICEPQRGEDGNNCPNDCIAPVTFTLTYTAGPGGTISGVSPQTVNLGERGAQVIAVANSGYHFTNWSDGLTTASRTDANIQGNINLTAYFEANPVVVPTTFTLTYTAGPGGTILGTSPQTVNQGESGAQVTAVANSGYHFTDWSDGSTSSSRTDTNIQGNINLMAYFEANPAPVGGGSALLLGLHIENLQISKITSSSAEISWQTNKPAYCATNLGKTSEYEKEIISETEPLTSHLSDLTSLDAFTPYHFNIVCKTVNNLTSETGDRYFNTLSVISDVSNFIAVGNRKEISLSWKNPADPNFKSVKLVRNEKFYPANINDGTIIYQGVGVSFSDTNVETGKIYYYGIFAEYKNNSLSQGEFAFAQIQPTAPVIPVTSVVPGIQEITITTSSFSTNGTDLPAENNKIIKVLPNTPLTISTVCQNILGAQKLAINLQNKENNSSFALPEKNGKNFCEVSLVSPQTSGTYPLEILIMDSKNKIIGRMELALQVLGNNNSFWTMGAAALWIYILIALAIIFFIMKSIFNESIFKNKRK